MNSKALKQWKYLFLPDGDRVMYEEEHSTFRSQLYGTSSEERDVVNSILQRS